MEKRKINKGLVFLYIFLLLPFLRIYRINEVLGSSMMNAYQIISCLIFIVTLFASVNKIKFTKTFSFYFFYQATILFSTFLFRDLSWGIMLVIIVNILVFILTTVHLQEIILAVCVVLVPSIIINFGTTLMATGEMNEMFFLGGKNALGTVIIPTIFILALNSLYKKDKISAGVIIVSAIGIISTVIAGSATGIVVSAVAIFFFIYFVKSKPKKFFWFGITVFIYTLFLFFSEEFFKSDMWVSFVEMLGKDATLTSRTAIWIAVSDLIKTSLLFGFGRGLEFSYSSANHFGETQLETHNIALQVLLDGGIIAMIFFVLFLVYVIKRLDMREIKHRVIFAAIMVLLVNGLTESVANTMYTTIIFSIANAYATREDTVDKSIETNKVII